MIPIKPFVRHEEQCPHCGDTLRGGEVLWQGIHVCVSTKCEGCGREYLEDMRVGHATYSPYRVEMPDYILTGDAKSRKWLGEPLRQSLMNPSYDLAVGMTVHKKKASSRVIIVNTIDYLYGHALLKLLNVQREYEQSPELGIIVIVQKSLEWMVPAYVSEIWTVDVPFSKARNFYPLLHHRMIEELIRFDEVYVSPAYSHPSQFEIEQFTGVSRYDEEVESDPRITFVWREDRLWSGSYHIARAVQKFPQLKRGLKPLIYHQRSKIIGLFRRLRESFPDHRFTVAGLGRTGSFPAWISDERVSRFDRDSEMRVCEVYAASRLVIGIHGSNMLLPSAHAGMTIDLMPKDRWGNYAQDILFHEKDHRLTAYKYRFVPMESSVALVADMAAAQLKGADHFNMQMMEERQRQGEHSSWRGKAASGRA
ncbi:hypothetical protein [Paenibacillus polymyxa]|uniref:hypothetical protein n=1 Tax=Paenibacillus polymyxa TaxID=1406 RepID=UPI0032169065